MTYKQICATLEAAGIDTPREDAARLVEHFCGISPAELVLRRDEQLTAEGLEAAVARRASRYPLQYLIGEWGFYNDSLAVCEGVLIPREDTELLVETAIEQLPEGAVFADLGCGSGCICTSVLRARPDVRAVAVDMSRAALRLTEQNGRRLGVESRLAVWGGDMLDGELWERLAAEGVGAVLSNPPYIPTAQVDELAPELEFEPRVALDGGEDGLDFYRRIAELGAGLLGDGRGLMLLECGAGQSADIGDIGEKYGFEWSVRYDLGGHDRVVLMRRSARHGIK